MQPTFRVLFCTALVAVSGCRNDEVREYTAPKDQAPAVPPSQGMGMGMGSGSQMQAAGEVPEWTLPSSWQQKPGEGMRYATLVVDATAPALEIRVTPLGLAAKDPLGNINRWRGQIGLEPVGPEQLSKVARSEKINGRDATLADMTGPAAAGQPAARMLAAILPGDESVWFFLMTGPADRVGKQAKAFDGFIHSVRLGAGPAMAAMPSDHPPVEGMPSDHPPMEGMPGDHPPMGMPEGSASAGAPSADMAWVLPQGWQQAPSTNSFRVGTFQFTDGGQSGEVAITKFPGGAGGVLENINRWRGQIGLAPVNSLQEQPMQKLTVAGIESARIDLVAKDGEAGARKRMIVVTLPHDDITYFIKMTGPSSLLDKHTKDFDAFLKSVQFPGARS